MGTSVSCRRFSCLRISFIPFNPVLVVVVWVVALLIFGLLSAFIGWIVAQCSRQCRIPAVLGFAMSFQLLGVIAHIQLLILFGANRALWLSMLYQTAMTILILFGGGLLTGPLKCSMSAQPGIPLDELSEPQSESAACKRITGLS